MLLYAVLMPFDWKTNENLVKEMSRLTSRKLNTIIILIKREFVCINFNGESLTDDFR